MAGRVRGARGAATMLVLTRRRSEKLYIGGDICVTVVRLEGGQVRLGIEAPRHVAVVRAELTRHGAPADEPAAAERAEAQPPIPAPEPDPAPRRPAGFVPERFRMRSPRPRGTGNPPPSPSR